MLGLQVSWYKKTTNYENKPQWNKGYFLNYLKWAFLKRKQIEDHIQAPI